MKFSHKIFCSALFLAVSVTCSAQIARYVEKELADDVSFLSDSLNSGRGFGTKEAQSVIFYIDKAFKEAGLWTRVQSFEKNGQTGHNVIGFTPGYYDRYVVVGAHFDGLGSGSGNFYPGADSNASGVAALLMLARDLGRISLDTGIVFVAFDGYCEDLSGSGSFLSLMTEQKYRITLMVNLDILGSTAVPVVPERRDYLIALGGGNFRNQLNQANVAYGLHLSYDYYGSSRFTDLFYKSISDQKWFIEKKIPCVMFTSGITMDTNKISDKADKLDYGIMARRVGLIERWLRLVI